MSSFYGGRPGNGIVEVKLNADNSRILVILDNGDQYEITGNYYDQVNELLSQAVAAKNAAEAAQNVATTAQATAVNAQQNAENARDAAKISETNANNSEKQAKLSENAATNAQQAAEESKIAAANSANAAALSEENSKLSETNTADSELNALNYKNAAKASEENANKAANKAQDMRNQTERFYNDFPGMAADVLQQAKDSGEFKGDQGDSINLLSDILELTSEIVAEDTVEAVGAYMDAQGIILRACDIKTVNYRTRDNIISYWYYKRNGKWLRVRITGSLRGIFANEYSADENKAYTTRYINEKLDKILEQLTWGEF